MYFLIFFVKEGAHESHKAAMVGTCQSHPLQCLRHIQLYLAHSEPSKWLFCPDKWSNLRTLGSGLMEIRWFVCVCVRYLLFAPVDSLSVLLHLSVDLRRLIRVYNNGFWLDSAKGRHQQEIWGWKGSEVSVLISRVPSLLNQNGSHFPITLMTSDNNKKNNKANWYLLNLAQCCEPLVLSGPCSFRND